MRGSSNGSSRSRARIAVTSTIAEVGVAATMVSVFVAGVGVEAGVGVNVRVQGGSKRRSRHPYRNGDGNRSNQGLRRSGAAGKRSIHECSCLSIVYFGYRATYQVHVVSCSTRAFDHAICHFPRMFLHQASRRRCCKRFSI